MAEILVIEDDPQLQQVMARILKTAGHVVHVAGNGRAGLQLFDECHPDLVITDIVMPEMEGIETIRALRRKDSDVPVLAVSGSRARYLEAATKLGATAALGKPFGADELLLMVEDLLGIRQSHS